MSKLIALFVVVLSFGAHAQERDSVVFKQKDIAYKNLEEKEVQKKELYSIGEMKSSRKEFLDRLRKEKRIQIDIIPDDVGLRDGQVSLKKKPGKFLAIELSISTP